MAARSIASLTLSFALVSIPVRLYSATESSATIRFNLLTPEGKRVKQQYVADDDPDHIVPRSSLIKGYEFEKDRYVLFTPDELKQLEDSADPAIEIISFVPAESIDPLYFDKAYLLAPDRRGGKPYALLREAMRESGRCALARWTWKSRQNVVQIRPHDEGLVLQQLLYADEVRSPHDLAIEDVELSAAELKLALQLIEQISVDSFDPTQYRDEERARILEAIDRKIAGQEFVTTTPAAATADAGGAQIIDLMQALRASLGKPAGDAGSSGRADTSTGRQPAKRGAARTGNGTAPSTRANVGGTSTKAAQPEPDAATPRKRARRAAAPVESQEESKPRRRATR